MAGGSNRSVMGQGQGQPIQAFHGHHHGHFPMMAPPQTFFSDLLSQASMPPIHGCNQGGDCSCNQQLLQAQAKIQLLERKIQAKDKLFDDSLSSSFAGCAASTGAEYTQLINKLKKRVMTLKAKNEQSESEIDRLTKTVRVVEVEVKEENEPLRNEIARLTEIIDRLQSQLDGANSQLDAVNRQKIQMSKEIDELKATQQKNLLSIEELKLKLQNTQTNL